MNEYKVTEDIFVNDGTGYENKAFHDGYTLGGDVADIYFDFINNTDGEILTPYLLSKTKFDNQDIINDTYKEILQYYFEIV